MIAALTSGVSRRATLQARAGPRRRDIDPTCPGEIVRKLIGGNHLRHLRHGAIPTSLWDRNWDDPWTRGNKGSITEFGCRVSTNSRNPMSLAESRPFETKNKG